MGIGRVLRLGRLSFHFRKVLRMVKNKTNFGGVCSGGGGVQFDSGGREVSRQVGQRWGKGVFIFLVTCSCIHFKRRSTKVIRALVHKYEPVCGLKVQG